MLRIRPRCAWSPRDAIAAGPDVASQVSAAWVKPVMVKGTRPLAVARCGSDTGDQAGLAGHPGGLSREARTAMPWGEWPIAPIRWGEWAIHPIRQPG